MTRWYGKLLGFIAGWLLLRHPAGAVVGLLIGHAFDSDWFKLKRSNPYRIFDLTSDATDAEVDQAYRRLISQYHPDKMSGAAEELRRQADRKAGEINAAYDRIKTMRRKREGR
jgi:preprotein translocase subunit Sec63